MLELKNMKNMASYVDINFLQFIVDCRYVTCFS